MEIETFHKANDFIGWTETSAKEGLMVNDSMRYIKFIPPILYQVCERWLRENFF